MVRPHSRELRDAGTDIFVTYLRRPGTLAKKEHINWNVKPTTYFVENRTSTYTRTSMPTQMN